MDFLRRLLDREDQSSSTFRQIPEGLGVETTLFEGSIRLEVAGESFHQDALEELAGSGTEQGDRVEQLALLIPEPDNPHDPHAVGVWINRRQVGYLTRENAAVLQPAILSYHTRYGRAVACRSLIVGGWNRESGERGHFGVKLSLDPADLGIDPSSVSDIRQESRDTSWTGTSRARSSEAGTLGGRHYTEYVEDVKRLRRDGREAEAEALLLSLPNAVEEEAKAEGWGAAPWYYEQLAIMYRKRKDYVSEVNVLERFASMPHAPGVGPSHLAERLEKARAHLEERP